MPWSEALGRGASALLSPSWFAIVISALFAIGLPLLVHLLFYRPGSAPGLPTFLVVGPSGSGKTALVTYLQNGTAAATHTSQTPLPIEVTLPQDVRTGSSQYRSVNDPTLEARKRFMVLDTPGHGKLRSVASEHLAHPDNLKGIIFVVDAADLSASGPADQTRGGLREAAEYLYDLLLRLQRIMNGGKSSRRPKAIPVLIAANKQDLFTALPAPLVKTALEGEMTQIRESRSKGLLDVGTSQGATAVNEDENDWLGDPDEKQFRFTQMSEVNVSVEILGGQVLGSDGADAKQWWQWIGAQM
ncbi:MAG: hypothetical protein M1823_001769 [Watsoniomyces obsoletus]|nr:MAG: hypothetical protein M1823_001769 [Watsoniomyces obsoletus]